VNITHRQREILDFVRDFVERRRYAPSIQEICRNFGLKSTATVHKHLRNLEERGVIRRDWNRSRSIEVLAERLEEVAVRLPLVGELVLGAPIAACPHEDSLAVPASLTVGGRAHVLKVRGDALHVDHILDGDYLVLVEVAEPEPGSLVVAVVRANQAVVGRYHSDGVRVRLVPSGRGATAVTAPAAQVKVQGVVVGLVRRYPL